MVIEQELIEPLFEFDGKAVAAREHTLEEAEIRPIHGGDAQQRLVQGGNAGDEVALVLEDKLGVALGGEAGHQHAAPALRKHGMDGNAQAEAMEHGHDCQHLIAGTEHRVGGDDLLTQRVEVEVGKQDPLGDAGGAAAVQDHGGILALLAGLVLPAVAVAHLYKILPADDGSVRRDLLHLAAFGEHIAHLDGLGKLILDAGDDDVVEVFHVLADSLELVVELVQRDGADAARFPEIKLDLLFAGKGMHHIGDAAHQVDRVEHDDGLRTVGHADGDLIPFPDADGLEGAGAQVDLLHEFFVGGGFAHKIVGHVIRILLGHLFDCFVHTALEIFQRSGDVAQVLEPGGAGLGITHSLPPHWQGAPAGWGAPVSTSVI